MQILGLFEQAQLSNDWEERFKSLLENKNLKKDYKAYHSNPGGNRTYRSQLEALGLIYRDGNQTYTTKAGEDLKNRVNPLLVLQTQLCRMQYPSVYSVSSNVNIDPTIKVKPIVFLIQLLRNFGYLTRDEVAVAVIYGHNHDEALKRCIHKINCMREGNKALEQVIDNQADIYTAKTASRTIEQRLNEIKDDIANTFENWMESAQLISWQIRSGERVNVLNPAAQQIIEFALANLDVFISTSATEIKANKIGFSRKFGNWSGQKDTRSQKGASGQAQITPEALLLRDELIGRMGMNILSQNDLDDYKNEMLCMGLEEQLIEKTILKYHPSNLSVFEDQYIRLSNSGNTADGILFEKATATLLSRLNNSVELTGQLKRPNGAGSYADIILTDSGRAMLIDTKASSTYSLPHQDKAKAVATYIPAWTELRDVHGKTNAQSLHSLCYIAGGFASIKTLNNKLEDLRADSNDACAVNAIRSYSLLKYAQTYTNTTMLFEKCEATGLLDLT